MPWGWKWGFCGKCSKPVYGQFRPGADMYCLEHRIQRSAESALQLANKSGPFYDKWKQTGGPKGRPRKYT